MLNRFCNAELFTSPDAGTWLFDSSKLIDSSKLTVITAGCNAVMIAGSTPILAKTGTGS